MNGFLSSASRIGAGVWLASVAACAAADGLVVVHDAGGTVDAAPYLERPGLSPEAGERGLDRARVQLAGLKRPQAPAFAPVNPGALRAGPPSRLRVPGLPRPVFAVGSDRGSLEWLEANAQWLRKSGAQGFLVNAPSEDAWSRASASAARLGLSLDPMPGAALADAYAARSYPFVAEPSP